MLSTATKGVQGFGDDYGFGDRSRPAPRTTFGYVGSKPDDPGTITWFPEESKSATPPPEESKLSDVEPIEPMGESKSKLLASLLVTNQQSVQSSTAEQTADSGSRPTGAHRTTTAVVTEQHDKDQPGRRTLERQMPCSPDRFTYWGPSPSSVSTSSSLVATTAVTTAATATARETRKKMTTPPIEAGDVDAAMLMEDGEERDEVMSVNRPVRFGVLPEGENQGGCLELSKL